MGFKRDCLMQKERARERENEEKAREVGSRGRI